MSILDDLKKDMIASMKRGDKARLSAVRLLISALKSSEKDKREALSEAEEIDVLAREAKRRRESIAMFEEGGRAEMAAAETAELAVIQEYLPQPLSEDDVLALLKATIAESGATSKREMGRVMGLVMPKLKGRFDGKAAKDLLLGLLE